MHDIVGESGKGWKRYIANVIELPATFLRGCGSKVFDRFGSESLIVLAGEVLLSADDLQDG